MPTMTFTGLTDRHDGLGCDGRCLKTPPMAVVIKDGTYVGAGCPDPMPEEVPPANSGRGAKMRRGRAKRSGSRSSAG